MIRKLLNKIVQFFKRDKNTTTVKKKRPHAIRQKYTCASCKREFWAYPNQVAQFQNSLVYCQGVDRACNDKPIPPDYRSDEEIQNARLSELNGVKEKDEVIFIDMSRIK